MFMDYVEVKLMKKWESKTGPEIRVFAILSHLYD